MSEEIDTTRLPWVRSSERSDFKKCPQRWWWRYVEQLVPANTIVGAREFGTGIHLCLAEWYSPLGLERGKPLLETWEEWTKDTRREAVKVKEFDEEEWVNLYELGKAMLVEYENIYGNDPHWDVIAVEIPFSANVANQAISIGTIDLVVRDLNDGTIKIVDHKTCKTFPNVSWLNLDDQCGSYSAFAQHILLDQGKITKTDRVKGMEYNWLRKARPDERPVNALGQATNKPLKEHFVKALTNHGVRLTGKEKAADLEVMAAGFNLAVLGEVSKVQPTPTLQRDFISRTAKEKKRQLDRLVDDVTVMEMARNRQLPILKTPGALCSYCDFFALCEVDESQADSELMKKRAYKKLDPYHDHREGANNSKLTVRAHKQEVDGGKRAQV